MESLFYETLDHDQVMCVLCPKRCRLKPGQCGVCRVRCNTDGRLSTTSYGQFSGLTTEELDWIPIRFHPHYKPSDKVLSFGNVGCNLHCIYCRNHQLSQGRFPTEEVSTEGLVQRVKNLSTQGIIGICFTYNEPGIAPEFNMEVARAVRAAGFATVFDTNAYFEPEAFLQIIEPMDILSIDLKGFDDSFYQAYCDGNFEPVWDNIIAASETGKHVELTMTIVAGGNDHPDRFRHAVRDLSVQAPKIAGLNLAPAKAHHLLSPSEVPSAATMADFKKTAETYFRHVSVTEP